MLLDHPQIFHTDILVEARTYLGDMIYAMKDHFKEIYLIELSEELHARAKSAFRKYPHIHLVAEDSTTALELVLDRIQERSCSG
jgi:predicted O-methyltransferase YrrM